jgi:hypothetical protein
LGDKCAVKGVIKLTDHILDAFCQARSVLQERATGIQRELGIALGHAGTITEKRITVSNGSTRQFFLLFPPRNIGGVMDAR